MLSNYLFMHLTYCRVTTTAHILVSI